MKQELEHYLPVETVAVIQPILEQYSLVLKIKSPRKTRHGDYRKLPNGLSQITINASLNQYAFLLTLIHEIAHHVAYLNFGRRILPHGKEWKHSFINLAQPFLREPFFDNALIPILKRHFYNPKASSDTDSVLALALKQFDPPNDKNYIFELSIGTLFKIPNGRIFKRGHQRTKRFECVETVSGRTYLFSPNAEVELIQI
jgi:SprT protein